MARGLAYCQFAGSAQGEVGALGAAVLHSKVAEQAPRFSSPRTQIQLRELTLTRQNVKAYNGKATGNLSQLIQHSFRNPVFRPIDSVNRVSDEYPLVPVEMKT